MVSRPEPAARVVRTRVRFATCVLLTALACSREPPAPRSPVEPSPVPLPIEGPSAPEEAARPQDVDLEKKVGPRPTAAWKPAGPPIELDRDLPKRWRRSEFDRPAAEPLAARLLERTDGAASPEALARAYADALARRDEAAMATLVLSREDLTRVFADATTEKARRGISIEAGSVFLGLAEAPGPRTVEPVAFVPGQEYRVHAGIRLEGVRFAKAVTLLDRSVLEVRVDGAPRWLELMMMMEVDGRWKLFERVFVREARP